MFVYCEACHYDSGDFDTSEELAAHVNHDGGRMKMTYDERGHPQGWEIICPERCGDQYIHLD